jgi:hypothetical protein
MPTLSQLLVYNITMIRCFFLRFSLLPFQGVTNEEKDLGVGKTDNSSHAGLPARSTNAEETDASEELLPTDILVSTMLLIDLLYDRCSCPNKSVPLEKRSMHCQRMIMQPCTLLKCDAASERSG